MSVAAVTPSPALVRGPARSGRCSTAAPALTLTDGHAALHQAIVGDRLRLALDRTLAARRGRRRRLAHPALVWDVAIGQSTVATGRVIANLFYRGLLLRRAGAARRHAAHDDRGRRAAREPRPRRGAGRPASPLLRIRTVDQDDRPVLDFNRCAMLPLRDAPTGEPGDEVGGAADLDAEPLHAAAAGLDLAAFRAAVPGPHFDDVAGRLGGGRSRAATSSTRAPALARLTLNVAMAHHDAASTADGRRLVYGGHTIGLAAGAGDARAARRS